MSLSFKSLVALLLLLSSGPLLPAQEGMKGKPVKSWSLELGVATPSVKMKATNARFGHTVDNIAYLPGYTVGFNRMKSNGWGLSFGMNYRPLRFDVEYNFAVVQPVEGIPERSEFRQSLVGLQYEHALRLLKVGQLELGARLGTELSFFARRQDRTVYGEGEVEFNTLRRFYNTANLNFHGAIDLSYSFHEYLGFRIQCFYKAYPFDMAWDAFMEYESGVFGGEASIIFHL